MKTESPASALCSNAVVLLRPDEAEALWLAWHNEAFACDELAKRAASEYDRGWNEAMAQAHRLGANWLQSISRRAGYQIPRQPQENSD